MVARTPPKQRRSMVAPLNPILIRETVNKVDKCMARLQELQYTVSGGTKVIAGVSLSPRSTRGYLRTSLRCKQETLRIKNGAARKSPVGKFPASTGGEWRRMSLPAMLLGETVGEILQASQFAKEIVAAVAQKTKRIAPEDPKTPVTEQRKPRPLLENTELKTRRKKEKQNKLQLIRSESDTPSLQRARSRINFKVSPPKKTDLNKDNSNHYVANRVSPKHKPWAKKTVLFPNPLFLSTPSALQQPKFCKTRSPIIARSKQQTPHKFLIKSPPSSSSKYHVKIKSPPLLSLSPTRSANLSKKSSPKVSTASKLRRSFSPSRLANRLVSPLKGRKSVQKIDGHGLMNGLKQRPVSIPKQFPTMMRI
ncbi:microtubule-binding protein TANGLED [Tripterygium wilfordii]|uniref:Microtubule-binding protein TANGLED n=1 Tax=Tripterygium wilfordii TaxID=458696 RepID=A0A7J7D156_TRIWF|nr:microtubule-binding protein TANGLED-like [Tripterygium wilfordii]KAF5740064.1 microtubule-binding protein TANGLED [Tripterygium wilfordii]